MSDPKPSPSSGSATPPTYTLRTVADFLTVPPEKLGACLVDFCAWLDMVRRGIQLVAEFPELRMKSAPDEFGWIDDGKHIATVTVEHAGQVITREDFEFARPEAEGHV